MDKTRIFETAGRFAARGQLDKAAKEYQRVLDKDPRDVRALQKLAEIHQKNGKLESAAELLLKVAEGFSEQGFFLKAVAVYKQILKFGNDDRIDVNLKLAQLYQQLGLINDATQQHQAVANYYDRLGNVRESLAAVRRMVDLDPDNVASRVKLGELYAREQMTGDAVAELKRAASYLKKNNRAEDHLRVLERVAQLVPDDVVVAKELAQQYLSNADTKRALARLQVCFRQNPRDVETLQLLARAFTDLGQTAKTVSVYRELGHVYAAAGQTEQQRQTLEKLLELAPGDAEATKALKGLGASAEPELATVIIADDPEPTIIVEPETDVVVIAPPPSPPPRTPTPEQAQPTATPSSSSPPARVRTGLGSALPPPAGTTPAVTKVLTEVDVYLKYGLVPKAESHLRAALAEHANSIALHEKLVTLLDRREEATEAEQIIATLVALARTEGDTLREAAYLQELGQRQPDHPLVVEASVAADLGDDDDELDDIIIVEPDETELLAAQLASEMVAEETSAQEDDDDISFDDLPVRESAIEVEAVELEDSDDFDSIELEATVAQTEDDDANGFDAGDIELDDSDASSTIDEVTFDPNADYVSIEEAPSVHAPPVDDAPEPVVESLEDDDALETAFDASDWLDDTHVEAPVPAADFDANAPGEPASEPSVDPAASHIELFTEELEEADFLLQQGLEDDARYALESILAQAPEHPDALAMLNSIQASPAPSSSSEASFEPSRSDGFDLSAELADEFDSIERTPSAPHPSTPVSVDEVFGEFELRRPETIAAEDSQTHYDLGIAYKEMGMLDEAIHEFEVALGGTGTRRFVDCLTMIGICLLEKKQPEEAIERFRRALKTPGLTLEGSKEAHFQIGLAREALGQPQEAFGHFARVYKADPAFRNVREKVLALRAHAKSASAQASGNRPRTGSSTGSRPAPPPRPQEPPAPPAGSSRGKIGFV